MTTIADLLLLHAQQLEDQHAPRNIMQALRSGAAEITRLRALNVTLLTALEAAVSSGMVPKSSALEGGANRHVVQLQVADQIRAALAKAQETRE